MSSSSELIKHVDAKIRRLQKIYLDGHRPSVAGTLARLRRAVGTEPGSDPWAWTNTVEELPEQFVGRGDEASRGESAVYAAITLYAVHQQSKSMPMHQSGPSLGLAVKRLGAARGSEGASAAVKRRFDAVMTASTFSELQHHARGIIQQLRAADVAMDYGRFADDLRLLQHPSTADSVRLRWGRDYAFDAPVSNTTTTSASTTTEGAAS